MRSLRRIVTMSLVLALLVGICGSVSVFGAAQGSSGDIDVPFDPVKVVRRIWISTKPTKRTYQLGQQLDTTGMVVKATYSDGSTVVVTGYTVSGYSASTLGTQTITVTYSGKTATFEVTVSAPGDISGNGVADDQDVNLLEQYVAGQNVQVDTGAADINGDGTVDGKDAILLARYVAGWNVNIG